jgi:hypothetical protein
MHRVRTPAWRIAGSFAGWLIFTVAFLLFFQTAGVVGGLGGFCAAGGPYVIAVECPEAVVVFAPVGLFGALFGVAVAMFLARSFGTPLYLWAWPIAFVALGIQFIVGAFGGAAVVINVLIGLMFVVMGAVPFWYTIRGGAQPFLIGMGNVHGRLFSYRDTGRKSLWGPPKSAEGETVPPTPRDWALSLGIVAVAIPLGAWLSVLAFNAVGSAG